MKDAGSNNVISSLSELSPTRLSQILQDCEPGIVVRSLSVRNTKDLPYSTVAFLDVTIETIDHEQRRLNIFLKLIRHAKLGDTQAAADAEVDFYRNVAASIPSPPIVHCYNAETSSENGLSQILLDDLSSTHSQPVQSLSPSFKQALSAVDALARCHARWWKDDQVGINIGKVMTDADLAAFISDLEVSVDRFLRSLGSDVSQKQRSAYALMLANAGTIWGRLTMRKGLTITHGDCHWWNFLYPNDPTGAVHIIDWHLWHVDLGARDLSFLLALGGFVEPQPEIESSLLRSYHRTLIENGVTDYSFDDLYLDYRWSSIRNLNIPVIFLTQGKHGSTIKTALRRAFESFERLNCRELFA